MRPGPSVARLSSGAQPTKEKPLAVMSVNGRELLLAVEVLLVLVEILVDEVEDFVLEVEVEVLLVEVEAGVIGVLVLTTLPAATTTIVTGIHGFVGSDAKYKSDSVMKKQRVTRCSIE